MKLFILMPVYNEGKNLLALTGRIKAVMLNSDLKYEVIVYNDGSSDDSVDILRKNTHGLPLRIINNRMNKGLGVAFLNLLKSVCSMSNDSRDIAVIFDSDNTHNPEHIGQMISKIREGFDVVIASRYVHGSRVVGVPGFRKFLSYAASWVMRILFPIKGVKDYTCGYRAYSLKIVRMAFAKYKNHLIEENDFSCMAELLIKLRSLRIRAVEIPLILRYDFKQGESKMKIFSTIKRTILMLLRNRVSSSIKSEYIISNHCNNEYH